MVLQKENDPFGAACSLNDWSVRRLGKVGKQASDKQPTDTGRHSLEHFSTIDHNRFMWVDKYVLDTLNFHSSASQLRFLQFLIKEGAEVSRDINNAFTLPWLSLEAL
jgi:hypothetical protein